jgi:hypothetical protein
MGSVGLGEGWRGRGGGQGRRGEGRGRTRVWFFYQAKPGTLLVPDKDFRCGPSTIFSNLTCMKN